MKQQVTSYLFFVAFLIYVALLSNSAGAPVQTSGAPGEPTCGRSGCHAVLENEGAATIDLKFNLGEQLYAPNESYPIEISLSNIKNEAVNGFQIVALDSLNNNAGTWELLDSATTQIRIGTSFADRTYLTHTKEGIEQTSWSFNWQSPNESIGAVTFYLAVNDANANGGRTGDDIYITSLSITSDEHTSIQEQSLKDLVKIYPNPTSDFIYIKTDNTSILAAKLFTANGQLVQQFRNPSVLDLTNFETGLYLLELQTASEMAVIKIVLQ